MLPRLLRLPGLLLLPLSLVGLDCSNAPTEPPGAGDPPPTAALSDEAATSAPRLDPDTLFAVLINGGERKRVNYRSHLQHLKELTRLLDSGRIDPGHVTIFASDGPDPAPDLAVREGQTEPDFWLLPRSGAGEHLRPPIEYVNSSIKGFQLRPATHKAIEAWFRSDGRQLRSGDTLLVYVTDHGGKTQDDLRNNTISLWNETLSVSQFQTLLDELDPGVRVVMVMSQCYGGSFANAIYQLAAADAAEPGLRGNVCGYYATTADRLAYGCYPEISGRDDVGHSYRLFEALAEVGGLPEAHRRALVTDRTPDVPNTSRDFFLIRQLEQEAERSGRSFEEVVDAWLGQAWKRRADWEPEIRLLDRIAHSFGLFSPRSLRELDAQTAGLPELADRLKTYAKRWKEALEAALLQNWLRFLTAHPDWRPRFQTDAVRRLDPAGRAELTREVLADLVPFTRDDRETYERLLALKRKADDAKDARYRTEVRLGAVLRMRTLLASVAGRVYLEHAGAGDVRDGYQQLESCEALALLDPPAPPADLAEPSPFPPLAHDRSLIESVMPSWMGIRYGQIQAGRREKLDLPRGAVRVMTVYPNSPAERAGVQVADLVLGTPGEPFEEPHSIREWIMRSELGRPTTLALLRGGERREVTLLPGPYPLELPQLPGPPKVGSVAPPVDVDPYRGGSARPDASRSRLLFFWATWCRPCKEALPELIAFANQRDVDVLAITDEEPEELDGFFAEFAERFPERVASDPQRTSFQSYGVSGTPTFVLVDASGVIRHYQRGYNARDGIGVDGWSYVRSSR